MLFNPRALLKLSKTTSSQKLFRSDCITCSILYKTTLSQEVFPSDWCINKVLLVDSQRDCED